MINTNAVKEYYDIWLKDQDEGVDNITLYTAYEEGLMQGLKSAYKLIAQMHDSFALSSLPGQFKGKE